MTGTVLGLGTGGQSVATSGDLGGARMEVLPGRGSDVEIAFGFSTDFARRRDLAIVFFTPGVAWEQVDLDVRTEGGSVSYSRRSGDGSGAFFLTPDTEGSFVVASSSAAGAVKKERAETRGIAGVFAGRCATCSGSWSAPDGRSRSWSGNPIDTVFAGEAGGWRWTWSGVAVSATAPTPKLLAAWAPVGDSWRLFAP